MISTLFNTPRRLLGHGFIKLAIWSAHKHINLHIQRASYAVSYKIIGEDISWLKYIEYKTILAGCYATNYIAVITSHTGKFILGRDYK